MADIYVLQLVQTPLDFVGGPSTYVTELSKHLVKKGVGVVIISPRPSRLINEIKVLREVYGVEIYYVDFWHFNSLLRAPWLFSVKAHKLISSLVKNCDVVNVHVESTFLQQLAKTFDSVKLVSTVHGIYPYEDIEVLKYNPLNFYRLLKLVAVSPQHYITLRSLVSKSEIVVPVASFLANLIRRMYNVDEKKIRVIPNSVDTEFFMPLSFEVAVNKVNEYLKTHLNQSIDEGAYVILYVGRVEPRKGLHILLKSLAYVQSKDWNLIVVGGGDQGYITRLKREAERHSFREKVFFAGRVSRRLLPYFYSASHIYVLPSMFEGLPATILEAMACGTPVIATSVSGIPEAVIDGFNGLLVKNISEQKLAKAIDQTLKDNKFRQYLALNARRTAVKYFSWKINAEKYIQIYRQN